MGVLVQVCQQVRYLTIPELNAEFKKIRNFDPTRVQTEAEDKGRPQERPSKVVFFLLDNSVSMKANDVDVRQPTLTRFEACKQCIIRILRENVAATDLVSVVCFGHGVQGVIPATPKGDGRQLEAAIQTCQIDTMAGTVLFEAVSQCVQTLCFSQGVAPDHFSRWLVCLTDGDDVGSSKDNQFVTNQLTQCAGRLNMITITVESKYAKLKPQTVQAVNSWAALISKAGCVGKYVPAEDASKIMESFNVVAQVLERETRGSIE